MNNGGQVTIAEKHYGKGKGAKHTEIVKANSPQ